VSSLHSRENRGKHGDLSGFEGYGRFRDIRYWKKEALFPRKKVGAPRDHVVPFFHVKGDLHHAV
jgi:hypothetical protein